MRKRYQIITTAIVVALVGVMSLLIWQERSDPDGPKPLSEMFGIDSTPSMFEADITEWTPLIRDAIAREDWERIATDLERLRKSDPDIYGDQYLDYLHARALIESGEPEEASPLLERYLEEGNPFRVLALQHAERIAVETGEPARASELRRTLIREFPDSFWRAGAVEREIESLGDDPQAIIELADGLGGGLPEAERRELAARAVFALVETNRISEAVERGFDLLDESVMDDAGEQVWEALDRPALYNRYDSQQKRLLAETAHSHRHFARAAEILREIEGDLSSDRDEIIFAIGRAFFWNENYAEAKREYLRGAASTNDREQQAIFYYHAARAAQLLSDDGEAEKLLTRSIAVPGRFDATAASLTQRMRTRLDQKRFDDASHDVQLLRRLFPRGESRVDASLGYAVAAVANGESDQALRTLAKIPRRSTDAWDRIAIAYWRGRAFESDDPLSALDEYLDVLSSPLNDLYKWFVRGRLEQPGLQREIDAAIERRAPRIEQASAAGDWDDARELQTEIVLMRPNAENLARLRSIYENIPSYAAVLDLEPEPLPALPLVTGMGTAGAILEPGAEGDSIDRGTVLLALGLDEEAVDRIGDLYPLGSMRNALTQSRTQREAGATKPSIYAIEVMMKSVPDDYVYELLPASVRSLLYPMYFEDLIREASTEHGADPTLVRSIMREESRFDPRAKSFAAARGLLQFIISTARKIGASIGLSEIESSDLYEPETIINLGAKYVADLLERFEGNRYRAAAAYNAGPYQSVLWSRLAYDEGDDYFYAAINFDETRHYVRKVMTSYHRYEAAEPSPERATEEAPDERDREDSNRSDPGDEGT